MKSANAVAATAPEIPTIELTVALIDGVGQPSATNVGIPRNQVTTTTDPLPPLRTQINIPIRVSVASLNNQRMIYVDQSHVSFGYQQYGTVIWTLDPNAGASFDPINGITFSDPMPEDWRLIIGDQQCVMMFDNRGGISARSPRKYTIVLDDGSTTLTDDPTVENDPPPPQP